MKIYHLIFIFLCCLLSACSNTSTDNNQKHQDEITLDLLISQFNNERELVLNMHDPRKIQVVNYQTISSAERELSYNLKKFLHDNPDIDSISMDRLTKVVELYTVTINAYHWQSQTQSQFIFQFN